MEAPVKASYHVRSTFSAGGVMHSFIEVEITDLDPDNSFCLDVASLGRTRLVHLSVQPTNPNHKVTWDGDLQKPKIWIDGAFANEKKKLIVEAWGR